MARLSADTISLAVIYLCTIFYIFASFTVAFSWEAKLVGQGAIRWLNFCLYFAVFLFYFFSCGGYVSSIVGQDISSEVRERTCKCL